MSSTATAEGAARAPLLTTIKAISFIVLSMISISLSVYLFLQFSGHPVEQILFGALAVAFEGSKLYALVDGHVDWVKRKYLPSFTKIVMYVLLAALSVIASYGFSLGALQRANLDPEVTRTTRREQQIEHQIEEINQQIQIFQDQRAELPEGWVTASQRLQESISELVERRTDLYDQLNEIEPPDFDLAGNAFVLIGESIGMSGEQVMFILLIILAISIELCIIFTSPSVKHPDKPAPVSVPPVNLDQEDRPIDELVSSFQAQVKEEPHEETIPTRPAPEVQTKKEEPKPQKIPSTKRAPAEEKIDAPVRDIPKRAPHEAPKRTKDGLTILMSKFIDLLFEDPHGHVTDPEAIKERFVKANRNTLDQLNLTLSEKDLQNFANKMWNALTHLKGPTGYLMFEYHDNTGTYVSNYTPSLLKSILGKKIRGSGARGYT